MKRFFLIFTLLVFTPTALLAASAYISDAIKITMRTAPGTEHKIIAMVPSGEKVNIIEPGKDWSKVTTANGKTGWVLTRFLSTEKPASIALKQLRAEHDNLLKKSAAPLEEISRLTNENKTLSDNLLETRGNLENCQTDFEKLRKESADFIKVKNKYKQASTQLAEQTTRADSLESQLSKIHWRSNIKWFLSGAGVLLLGFIIGYTSKRQRRRSSLL